MKINRKILSIPPYVSTSWKNIASLHVEGNFLVLVLHNSSRIEIPDLEKPILEAVFDAHAKYLEAEQQDERTKRMAPPAFMDNNTGGTIPMGFPLKIGMNGIEALGSAMQHNPDQADAPDIPPEIVNKIASIAKVLGIDDPDAIPKPEPHCNCMHCQIAKAMQMGAGINNSEDLDEEVSEEDLKFRSWDVHQEDDKLYSVTNPIDQQEHYSVFLGEPIGCTCGNKNCEHIRAVLNS